MSNVQTLSLPQAVQRCRARQSSPAAAACVGGSVGGQDPAAEAPDRVPQAASSPCSSARSGKSGRSAPVKPSYSRHKPLPAAGPFKSDVSWQQASQCGSHMMAGICWTPGNLGRENAWQELMQWHLQTTVSASDWPRLQEEPGVASASRGLRHSAEALLGDLLQLHDALVDQYPGMRCALPAPAATGALYMPQILRIAPDITGCHPCLWQGRELTAPAISDLCLMKPMLQAAQQACSTTRTALAAGTGCTREHSSLA